MPNKVYQIPKKLENVLLSYVKETYLPERMHSKAHSHFNSKDVNFFARGVAEMSDFFTSERGALPKNYLNRKDLRAGYILYFVMSNFPKVIFCLDEIAAAKRFAGRETIKIADIGCGPGTASLAAAEYFSTNAPEQKVEIVAIDQNTRALHDTKKIFSGFVKSERTQLYTKFGQLYHKNVGYTLKTKYDIIILSNFLNEIGNVDAQSQLLELISTRHIADDGIVIVIEPALRSTSRNLMQLRDEVAKGNELSILAPCMGSPKCKMLESNHRDWCHMYISWKSPEVIDKIDQLIGNKKNYLKFSYLILGGSSAARTGKCAKNLYRTVSAPMRSKGKIELLLCGERGITRVTRQDKDATSKNFDAGSIGRGIVVEFDGTDKILKETTFKKSSA